MPKVPIHEIELNTVLSEPVLDSQGRILLEAGSTLTPALLRKLESWSISQVSVEPPEQTLQSPIPLEESDNFLQRRKQRAIRFAKFDNDPEMQILSNAFELWEDERSHATCTTN